jgi:membrane-associated phospholipid phosphatase
MFWRQITDFGDSGVMVPACLAIGLWLTASSARRDALQWLVLFGAAATLVVCTKVAFIGWDVGVSAIDFTGISGHAMSATSVLTVAGLYLGATSSRKWALAGAGLGYGLGVLISISRVMIGLHSVSEVVAGCLLGAIISAAMIKTAQSRRTVLTAPTLFVLALLAIVVMRYGDKAPSEQLITRVALRLSGHATPYTRYGLRPTFGELLVTRPWRVAASTQEELFTVDWGARPDRMIVEARPRLMLPSAAL